jgi:3-oxoadipate enol-lactonase
MDKKHQIEESPVRKRFVETGNARLHVIDEGPVAAPAVLFSHSIMTNAGMWNPQASLLRDTFRVVRYDSRGHGQSTAGSPDYSMGMLATDVIAILDALDLGKVHFVGLSLGGIVGFDLALNHPRRLLSLAICDARADSPEQFARPWDARIEAAQWQGMQALVEPTMARWFGSDFLQTAQADEVRSMIRDTSLEGFVATARALQSYDYRRLTGCANAPITLIAGERDGVLPSVMQSLATQIEHASFELIASAGHLPNLENPQAFNEALLRHLRSAAMRA